MPGLVERLCSAIGATGLGGSRCEGATDDAPAAYASSFSVAAREALSCAA